MCGIAGYFEERPGADRAPIERMLLRMISRGPDDGGHAEVSPRSSGRLLLGARRLAILDLSPAGHQPMRDPQTGNLLVFNGEIYNFRELRSDLASRGCNFFSHSDTEVILAGYRVWGDDVVARLRGMFAFALWDHQQQSLLLVRDRLGIKPLYYAHARKQFLFASELRALASSGLIPRELDATGLDSLLQFGSVQEPATMLRGVRLLPAGHLLRWQPGADALVPRRYWSLPAGPLQSNGSAAARNRLASEIREQLTEATRLHLVSDVPVSVFLSGGMDSAAIAALAARTGQPVSTFCVTFPEREYSEGEPARRAAEQIGCAHHEVVLQHDDVRAALPAAVAALDQPSGDGINTWFVARATRQAGIKVALSGLGGDELFAGYNNFRRVRLLERISRLPRWSRALTGLALDSRFFPARVGRVAAWLREEDGFGHPFFSARMLTPPGWRARLLQPEWLLATDCSVYADTTAEYSRLLAACDPVNRISALELSLYLRNTLLRDTDCASMAHSVEVRVPFVDHRLVENVMRIPGHSKLHGSRSKPLLASALKEVLPADFFRRPKRGFELPWDPWLRGPLRAQMEESFAEPGPVLGSVLNWPRVQELWTGFLDRRLHWSRPWLFHVLKQWCAQNL